MNPTIQFLKLRRVSPSDASGSHAEIPKAMVKTMALGSVTICVGTFEPIAKKSWTPGKWWALFEKIVCKSNVRRIEGFKAPYNFIAIWIQFILNTCKPLASEILGSMMAFCYANNVSHVVNTSLYCSTNCNTCNGQGWISNWFESNSFIIPHIGKNHTNWLWYFSEG